MAQYNNRQHVHQVIDFASLRWGKQYPTDLDAMLEFQNKLFVFVEYKYGNSPVPTGQKLALMRLADAITHIPSYVLVASHNTDIQDDIHAGKAIVTGVYHKGAWSTPKTTGITVFEAVSKLREVYGIR
jgi:hypothetical protein